MCYWLSDMVGCMQKSPPPSPEEAFLFNVTQTVIAGGNHYFRAALKIDDSTATSEAGNEDVQDTVGAVAVDCNGNVAYATSTGGISGKRCGRVGDSPIVG